MPSQKFLGSSALGFLPICCVFYWLWWVQDKKNRLYVVSALTTTQVDLKGDYRNDTARNFYSYESQISVSCFDYATEGFANLSWHIACNSTVSKARVRQSWSTYGSRGVLASYSSGILNVILVILANFTLPKLFRATPMNRKSTNSTNMAILVAS